MMSVFYFEQAFKYRARKLYAQGVECLQAGAQKGEVLCLFELHRAYSAGGWGLYPHEAQASYYLQKAKQTKHPIMKKNRKDHVFENETYALYDCELRILDYTFERIHATDAAYHLLIKSNVASMIERGAEVCLAKFSHEFKEQYKPFLSMLKEGMAQKHRGCIRLCKLFHERLNHPSYNITICDIFDRNVHGIYERLARQSLVKLEMFFIGRYINNGSIPESSLGVAEVYNQAKKCLAFYLDRISSAKQAVMTWILCAKNLKFSKDVYLLVAHKVWHARIPLLNC
jgi:hypothetical protein